MKLRRDDVSGIYWTPDKRFSVSPIKASGSNRRWIIRDRETDRVLYGRTLADARQAIDDMKEGRC